jgi:hypothetical protein
MNIQGYNSLVNDYETNYKNYISHLFNNRGTEAETSKQELIIINNSLKEQVINFSNDIKEQRDEIETQEQAISTKETEYEGLQNILRNKVFEQTSILEDEVKGDKKIKNVNEKLNRKNNMINILIVVNVILGVFLVTSIAYVLVLKNRNGTKIIVRNNKNKNTRSNSNKSLSNSNNSSNSNRSGNSGNNSNGLSSL